MGMEGGEKELVRGGGGKNTGAGGRGACKEKIDKGEEVE